MRLSDAIATGRVTVDELKAGDLRRCVLGMAANAVGIHCGDCPATYSALLHEWPWLGNKTHHPNFCWSHEDSYLNAIWWMFDTLVMHDKSMTLDQLIDWVRSVEPTETPALEAEQAVAGEVGTEATDVVNQKGI